MTGVLPAAGRTIGIGPAMKPVPRGGGAGVGVRTGSGRIAIHVVTAATGAQTATGTIGMTGIKTVEIAGTANLGETVTIVTIGESGVEEATT